jgi:AbrB family looped-hinge helix DNA binding protein
MNAQTKLSAKGQVVIPKDVRDRLGLVEGTVFDVIESGDGVILRKPSERPRISVDEALRRFREIYKHDGPPIPIEQLNWSPDIDDPRHDRLMGR